MPFGQRNVATYIHNICKCHLRSRGKRVVEAKEENTQLKILHQVPNTQFCNIPWHQLYKYIKLLLVGVYPAVSVFYACIVLKIAHTADNQNF